MDEKQISRQNLVGIIANPESGKDIRRLVAAGTVVSTDQKVNIVTRLLSGIGASGVSHVVMMPDIYGIGVEARENSKASFSRNLDVQFLKMPLKANEEDTFRAALSMNSLNVGCIVTLGGDGTSRLVAKGCGDVPIIPISTGTNNVFPSMIEGTVAGLAAGLVAQSCFDPSSVISRRKRIEITRDGTIIDMALIDAVVTVDDDIGSGAIWNVQNIRQIVQTCSSLNNIGLSSIGGAVLTIGHHEDRGLSLELGDGELIVRAPIAPGLIKEVPVKEATVLQLGDYVHVNYVPSIIALDGERRLRVKPDEQVDIRLSEAGPYVVDVAKVMEIASSQGIFQRSALA